MGAMTHDARPTRYASSVKTERRETPTQPERASSEDLPTSREELLALHARERRLRAAATPGRPEYRHAVERVAAIEIQIARVERAMDPPRV